MAFLMGNIYNKYGAFKMNQTCVLCGSEISPSSEDSLCSVCRQLTDTYSVRIEDACLTVRCLSPSILEAS